MSALRPDHDVAELFTVLLTDIEDSTRLWERHPDDMEAVVTGSTQLVVSVVEQHDGLIIKSTGDGMLAVFRDAVPAVNAAVEIQREASATSWPGIGRVHVRIGLNTGWCKLTARDVLGRAPNLASRLQSVGHGGQILMSDATAIAYAGGLQPSHELVDLGKFLIRGFDQPVGVHMVVAEGLRADHPPLRAATSVSEELPPDEFELFGRDEIIDDATLLLRDHRLVTLWGPGGVGKTGVAVKIASASRRHFDDGVRFVDLSPVTDHERVADAVVAALRAQPVGGELPIDALLRSLSATRALLLLDNCEQVLTGVRSVVSEVRRWCRGTHILTTSREPLGITGESALEVRTLAVPLDDGPVDDVARSPAVRLFVTRVAASQPDFRLSDDNVAVVAAICRTTDGLPLALELAAARAGIEGLDPHPANLSGHQTPRDDDPVVAPTATLSESLLRTLSNLTDDEAHFFARLAVFDGPFRRDLALGMAPNAEHAARQFDRLVRTAMVQRDDAIPPAYRVLAPFRDLARTRMDADDRTSAASTHAHMMLRRAEETAPLLRTEHEAKAVASLGSEFAEYRAAVAFFLERDALAEAARLVVALFQFCLFQPRPEGHRWATMVADRLVGDEEYAAEVHGAAALSSWFAGDMADAVERGRRAIASSEVSGGSDRWARIALDDALGYSGDLEAIGPHYLALISGLRNDEDPFWQVNGLGLEAISLTLFGESERATRRAERALAIARRLGNPDGMHWAFYALGRVLAPTDALGAREAFEQAMKASREVESRFHFGLDLVEWVALTRRSGEWQIALAGAVDLLDLLSVSGNRSQLSQALREAGLLLADAGRHEEAAVALLARRGLPAMPTGVQPDAEHERTLARLEERLDDRWARVRVKAQAFAEPDLIRLCRTELDDLQRLPPSRLPSRTGQV